MKIKNEGRTTYIEFLISDTAEKDESEQYKDCAKWLVDGFLPFNAYRYCFVGSDSDDAIFRIEIDSDTYEICLDYEPFRKAIKRSVRK